MVFLEKFRRGSEKSILKTQVDLLKEISSIISNEILDLDKLAENTPLRPEESLREGILLFTKKRYLESFNDIVNFLIEKLENEPKKNFKFFLSNVRTLIDIYSRLLYLCYKGEDEQARICLGQYLYIFARNSTHEKNSIALVREYGKTVEFYRILLDHLKLSIPSDPSFFNKEFMKKNKMIFPGVEKRLNEFNIVTSCSETLKVFPSASKKQHRFHDYFSDYVHGHPLMKREEGNERMWVISKVLIVSSQLAELISFKILKRLENEEIQGWLKKVESNRKSFTTYWSELREPLIKRKVI